MRICIFAVFLFSLSCSTNSSPPPLYLGVSGDSLGQFPPGGIPQIFAAGIISKGSNERDITFSPDQEYFFFTSRRNRFHIPKNNLNNYAELYNYLENDGNGLDDIYWVQSRDILEK
jgi:hypothetical protein